MLLKWLIKNNIYFQTNMSDLDSVMILDELTANLKVQTVNLENYFQQLEENVEINPVNRKRALLREVKDTLFKMKINDEENIY